MTEEAKIEMKPIDDARAFSFIEKVIQGIEDSLDDEGSVDFEMLEELQREGQRLLDEKEIIEDYEKRITTALSQNELDTARALVDRLEKECGPISDVRHWRLHLAALAAMW